MKTYIVTEVYNKHDVHRDNNNIFYKFLGNFEDVKSAIKTIKTRSKEKAQEIDEDWFNYFRISKEVLQENYFLIIIKKMIAY